MQVSEDHIKNAWDGIDNNLKRSLEVAYQRIKKFHEKEIPQSFTIKGEHGDTVKEDGDQLKMQEFISLEVELLIQVLF